MATEKEQDEFMLALFKRRDVEIKASRLINIFLAIFAKSFWQLRLLIY